MSAEIRPFRQLAASQKTTVNTGSQLVALNYTAGTRSIRFACVGTADVFIELGTSTATASTDTSLCLAAGQTEVFTIGNDVTHYAVIAGALGSTLYSVVGEGI